MNPQRSVLACLGSTKTSAVTPKIAAMADASSWMATPAFANAKIGMITKPIQGWSRSSRDPTGEIVPRAACFKVRTFCARWVSALQGENFPAPAATKKFPFAGLEFSLQILSGESRRAKKRSEIGLLYTSPDCAVVDFSSAR